MNHDELIARAEAVTSFLCGLTTLDGVVYGSRHPTRPGAFWWRRNLHDATTDLIAALRAEKEARALDAEKLATLERINLDLLGNLRAAEASAKRAEAMVAAAYRDAAESLIDCNVWCDSQERTSRDWHNGVTDARKHHSAHILARTPADASVALDRMIREAEMRGQTNAGAIFATAGAEARYIEDGENACPACGGSGHKDDASAALARIRQEAADEVAQRVWQGLGECLAGMMHEDVSVVARGRIQSALTAALKGGAK